jgi:hypothetical protein
MTAFCHTTIGWLWLQQVTIAQRALSDASGDDRDFYAGKLQACRFFFATELPLIEQVARLVRDAEPSVFEMQAEWF